MVLLSAALGKVLPAELNALTGFVHRFVDLIGANDQHGTHDLVDLIGANYQHGTYDFVDLIGTFDQHGSHFCLSSSSSTLEPSSPPWAVQPNYRAR